VFVASAKGKYALRLVIIAAFAWLLIDGGMGRELAIVGIVTMVICGLLIWLAKRIARPDSS
jgi:hypothetical protein